MKEESDEEDAFGSNCRDGVACHHHHHLGGRLRGSRCKPVRIWFGAWGTLHHGKCPCRCRERLPYARRQLLSEYGRGVKLVLLDRLLQRDSLHCCVATGSQ